MGRETWRNDGTPAVRTLGSARKAGRPLGSLRKDERHLINGNEGDSLRMV
jgi:hypothetical protein